MGYQIKTIAKRRRINGIYLFFILLFIMGFFSGSLVSYDLYNKNLLFVVNDVTETIGSLQTQNGFSVLLSSFFHHFIYIFVIWFLSLTIIGIILVAFIDFFIGFMYGIVIMSFVYQLGFKGLMLGFFYTFPQNIIIIPLMIYTCGRSVLFSLHIFQNFYQNGNRKILKDLMSQYYNQLFFSVMVLIFYALIVTIFQSFLIHLIQSLL